MVTTDLIGYAVPLAVFLAITLGAWGLLSAIADRPSSAEERLSRVMNPSATRVDAATVVRRQDRIQQKVTQAATKLGKSLRPSNEAELGKLRLMLLNAGFRHEQAVQIYLGLKALGLLVFMAVAGPPIVGGSGMLQMGPLYTVLA